MINKITMKSFEYDLRYTEAGLEVLTDYLLSDEMFWPLSIHPPEGVLAYPRLTMGGLLLSLTRLSAYHKTATQIDQLNQAIVELNLIRSKWRVAWEKKAAHNFSTRLGMWRDYIEEYRGNPQENADRYSFEIRLRVMLHLLSSEAGELKPSELDLLSTLDLFLKNALAPDDFVWEAELQSSFSVNDYWYLYGYLPASWKISDNFN
jgi:hypothetical protein